MTIEPQPPCVESNRKKRSRSTLSFDMLVGTTNVDTGRPSRKRRPPPSMRERYVEVLKDGAPTLVYIDKDGQIVLDIESVREDAEIDGSDIDINEMMASDSGSSSDSDDESEPATSDYDGDVSSDSSSDTDVVDPEDVSDIEPSEPDSDDDDGELYGVDQSSSESDGYENDDT